ncbi:alkaline phosphatase family protein [Caulobacter hibisci]|uniref:Alkaline phosphatase family protein n=1 Tax=Caulobacter hibisci TaxID=2035993 RepID=A0ABS0SSP8_9CAUL|nr:ectonucleotide pyrophosphatase/phosphodiesterase [Caulobacter hibisci]MBI1682667.1 alkaline phosphatase family protein [Caulobacter hibisci]
MTVLSRVAAFLAIVVLSGCATAPRPVAEGVPPKAALAILVSIDGFRADYLDRGDTPALKALADDGVRAAMRPSFPSLTFPNHYALVTGMRPDHNGIVSNTMEDPQIPGVTFTLSNHDAVTDTRWWSMATPIWATAEKQGVRAGTMFWPGSEAEIAGVRPTRWNKFDQKLPSNDRVDTLLSWLDDSKDAPLGLATLYFDIVDSAGHKYGPDSAEVRASAATVDAAIARLVEGLKARGLYERTNLVIVADHGMAPLPASQRVVLDESVDVSKLRYVGLGAIASLYPKPGEEAAVTAALVKPHPHMTCWEKGKIPARLHYGTNRRIGPIVCSAQTGWYITTAASQKKKKKDDDDESARDGGAHGYDNADPLMRAVFVAHGPAFKSGKTLPVFDNVDVYPLLAKVMGVRGEKVDGRLAPVAGALR